MNTGIRVASLALTMLALAPLALAQPRATNPPESAQSSAPFDATGYWVSNVTMNWEFRMVVPQRGQYTAVPINAHGKQVADAWDPAADEGANKQCEAYGAAALMQLPERLHISWKDQNTLIVEADAGMQTRLLRFKASPDEEHAPASWQGQSIAQWMPYRLPDAVVRNTDLVAHFTKGADGKAHDATQPHYGWLRVNTNDLLPGLLRKNGIPYSGQTHVDENWALHTEGDGEQWLAVVTVVHDPEYLAAPYTSDALFSREPDGSKWDPSPCTLRQ